LAIDDKIFSDYQKEENKFRSAAIYYPDNTHASYTVYLNPNSKTYYGSTTRFYDQRTGALIKTETPEDLNRGQALRDMYYDIHVGRILGLPGQLLAFFGSLIAASLPVTGFYIWYGRKFKKSERQKEKPLEEQLKIISHVQL